MQFLNNNFCKYFLITLFLINTLDSTNTNEINNCEKSSTTVNGVKIKCKDQLIFEENFERLKGDDYADGDNYRYLNTTRWEREIKIPLEPDYEFCVYHKVEKNIVVQNSTLKIIPTLLDDSYGENITYFGRLQLADCSGLIPDECTRKATSFHIIPPILSTRLTTKSSFTFRYGKIQIRAKFPEGDWLYPEMWLQPKYKSYGVGYSNGHVVLAMARGNANLLSRNTNRDLSSRLIECGLRTGPNDNITEEMVTRRSYDSMWTENFHIYTIIWRRNGFIFMIDDEEIGRVRQGANMAPYDLEFYLLLGVGVGGIRVFPDGIKSGYHEKPWKNVGAKAMLHFWRAKDQWLPSWQSGDKYKTSLQIDYVRIWSEGE